MTNYTSRIFPTAVLLVIASVPLLAQGNDSLTLDRAIRIALEQSPALQQATQSVAAAHARLGQTRSANLPQIDADAAFTRIDPVSTITLPMNGVNETFSFVPNNNYEAAVNIHQNIYDFGRTDAQLKLAAAGEQLAGDNLEQLRAGIAYQVVRAFYSILVLQQNIVVQNEQISSLNEALTVAQKRLTEGTALGYDVLTTRVRATTLQNQLQDIQTSLEKQRLTLRNLLGLPAGASVNVSGLLASTGAVSTSGLVARALSQRAELATARDAEKAAQLQVDVIRTSDNPSLGLNVSAGVKNGYIPDLGKPELNWVGGVRFSLPIYNGGRTSFQEEEAQANLMAARAHTADLERSISSEVDQAVADLKNSEAKLPTVDVQVQQAREALRIARVRYENGTITNTELLNVQTTYQEAQFIRTQYLYNVIVNAYAVRRAVGDKLW